MNLSQLCWIATMAYGLHILEEYALNWKYWAYSVTHIEVEWGLFYLANALVIVMGIVCAELAAARPTIALAFPALMLINAIFFHIGGFLLTRGRFSPGLITAGCSFCRWVRTATGRHGAAERSVRSMLWSRCCWVLE